MTTRYVITLTGPRVDSDGDPVDPDQAADDLFAIIGNDDDYDVAEVKPWPTAAELLADYIAEYEGRGPCGDTFEDVAEGFARFLLIEENVRGGYWLTTHRSPDDALDYNRGQDYAADWTPDELVDLETGDRYQLRGTTVPAERWEQRTDA